jgi:hypothetical protein
MVRSRSGRGREACRERERERAERLGLSRNLLRLPPAPATLRELSSSGNGGGLPEGCVEWRGERLGEEWRGERGCG